ncbi:MAG TPA: YciI family protein [Blastocatellia bacterium]|nr:YciI family protein [Blastocatellia bacterium]
MRFALILALLFDSILPASVRALQEQPQYQMTTYYLLLLAKGSKWTKEQFPQKQQLVAAHVKRLVDLGAQGKVVIAGPLADDTGLTGIVVVNASSPEEARKIEEDDPLVVAGFFSVGAVIKWWAAKGIMKVPPKAPASPADFDTYYFAIGRHGPKWTPEATPEVNKIQAGHMENINRMAKMGKLVIAGPFMSGGEYAGCFVFKVANADEALKLLEVDPAISSGRLVVDVHPWLVAKGSLP